jgi:hypothetical protein
MLRCASAPAHHRVQSEDITRMAMRGLGRRTHKAFLHLATSDEGKAASSMAASAVWRADEAVSAADNPNSSMQQLQQVCIHDLCVVAA